MFSCEYYLTTLIAKFVWGGGGLFITTAYIREKERPKKYKILKEGDRGLD